MQNTNYLLLVLFLFCQACATRSVGLQDESKFHRKIVQTLNENKPFYTYRKINRQSPLRFGSGYIVGNSIDGVTYIDRESAQVIWKFMVNGGVETRVEEMAGFIYFGGLDGQFYCLDASSGRVQWIFPTRFENIGHPLVTKDDVLFVTGNNTLYSLDRRTGRQKWLYARPETGQLTIRGTSTPAVKDNNVYTGFSDGSLVALTIKEGQVVWEKTLNRNRKFKDLDSDLVIKGEYIFALGYDSQVSVLKVSNGDLVWKYNHGGYGRPLVTETEIVFSSTDDEVISLNRETSKENWKYKLKNGTGTSPILFGDSVAIGESRGSLVLLEKSTGKLLETFEPGRGIMGTPYFDKENNEIAFVSGEGNFYILKK